MFDAAIKIINQILCHRSLHGAMAVTYGAACFGLDKHIVNSLAFAIYLAITVRG